MSTPLDAKKFNSLQGRASFPLRHRLYRFLWNFIWFLFASWTPIPLHIWRILLLRCAGANVSFSAHVYPSAKIWYPPNLTMKSHACLGPDVICYSIADITLEDNVIISQGAHLCTGSHDIDDPHHQLFAKKIDVKRGAWVATEAFIGPGVTIFEHGVVGARAVVFKNVPPHGVVVGNPAKLIRYRKFFL